jgi:outer membrane protein assembly factor BamB
MKQHYSPMLVAALLSVAAPALSWAAAGDPMPNPDRPLVAAPLPPAQGLAINPNPTNEWLTWGYDPERTAWNRAETTLSPTNAGNLKLKWSTKLPTPVNPVVLSTLTAPLVVSGVQTSQGRKNVLFTMGADDVLYAVDADSGARLWSKSFLNPHTPKKIATWLCSNTANATPVIDKARGLIFFMASDGLLRGHSLTDGAERMTPTEMVTPWARAWSLNLMDDVVYTVSGRACGEILDPRSDWAAAAIPIQARPGSGETPVQTDPSAVTAIDVKDLKSPKTTRFFTSAGRPAGAWGRGGPVRGPGNTLLFGTSDGPFDPQSGWWSDTVLRMSPKAARVVDSFTPANHRYIASRDLGGSGSPVTFEFAGKTLAAFAQKEGFLYLLDTNDMGGGLPNKHEKFVFRSTQLGNDLAAGTDPGHGVWGAITTYLTPDGRRFLYVPVLGPPSKHAPSFPVTNGAVTDGSVMAFEVVQRGEAIVAEPRWISANMIMPDPPSVANGVVFAIQSGGQVLQNRTAEGVRFSSNTSPESIRARSTPVGPQTLFAYDAVTGRQLFSSGDQASWVHFSQPVVALGKVYLITHDARVIAFGL